jgi:nitrogen fixation negative regulator NifL
MKKHQDQPANTAALRRRAEERLERQRPAGGRQTTAVETARLVHELQVHQIELEMQNEELRQAHAQVETLLAQYTDLYDFAPTGYMTLDREGTIQLVNVTGARLFGVERSRLVNRRFGLLVAEGDRRAFSDFLQKVFASQVKECCEVTLPQEGSQPLVVEIEGTRSADGQECRAVVLDITDMKRAAEELRSHNAALEAAANSVVITDRDGVIQWVNPAFTALTGYTHEEAIGKNPRDLVKSGRQDQAFYKNLWDTILAGRAWSGEIVNRRKDASLYTEELTITPLRDERGEIAQFIAIKQDVTERKLEEAALRESQARLMGVVDSAMDGIITIDAEERILVFNAAAEEMFGCPAVEAIGQTVKRFIPERFRTAHHQHIRRFAQLRDTPRVVAGSLRKSGLRANGEQFPFEASISRTEVNGRMLFTIILRDITERVRSEEARAQLEAQLNQAHKLDALGTLAGGIAHDFNNILGTIIGNTELARRDVGPSHPAMESIEEIRKASHRAKDLVQRILAFGRQHQQPQSVIPLRPVVEEALALLRATLPAGVELVTTLDADAPTMLADPTQIHQVLINLCTNAWHAMEGHAGRIDIRLDGITLDDEAARADANLRPGHFARLSVTDTGTGMDAATLKRIFEPFFTTKPVGQGNGLGLSVVYGIVKAHGGTITVTSQPGRGTTFSLSLSRRESTGSERRVGRRRRRTPAGGRWPARALLGRRGAAGVSDDPHVGTAGVPGQRVYADGAGAGCRTGRSRSIRSRGDRSQHAGTVRPGRGARGDAPAARFAGRADVGIRHRGATGAGLGSGRAACDLQARHGRRPLRCGTAPGG